jgi:two-component system, OmpR family, response regulator
MDAPADAFGPVNRPDQVALTAVDPEVIDPTAILSSQQGAGSSEDFAHGGRPGRRRIRAVSSPAYPGGAARIRYRRRLPQLFARRRHPGSKFATSNALFAGRDRPGPYQPSDFCKRSNAVSDSVARILVVDDDLNSRRTLVNYLEDHNMSIVVASGRQEILSRIADRKPILVILDPWTGREQGLDILREIRAVSDVPVIITTGHRCDTVERAIALELGADDYITKPLVLRELLARIRAVRRRRPFISRVHKTDPGQDRCRFGRWRLDRRNKRLTGADGLPVALTKGEYALLIAFLDAPMRPLTREHLLQATRVHEDIRDRSLDVQVFRLRRKLEVNLDEARVITTERGIGYVFALSVERLEPEARQRSSTYDAPDVRHGKPDGDGNATAALIDDASDLTDKQTKTTKRRVGNAPQRHAKSNKPHRTR